VQVAHDLRCVSRVRGEVEGLARVQLGPAARKLVNVPAGRCEEIDFWKKTNLCFEKFCN
jgi:hypothetical protein